MPDAQAPCSADLLIEHGTVITLDGARRVIEDGAVVVAGGRIVAVGSSAEIAPCWRARKVINALRKAVLPGLIDCHAHAGDAVQERRYILKASRHA
ncbi:hypothetical protein D8B24_15035 [Verminephrobacter aporrectodeae subsp. tuberculatae]|uniref:amidohydrolase family protein n=2 Tax=Verminephrobacter aporrectodeae TaxID=1110389 RepID=UPI00224395D6|nr:hypothetical protein [Verminephrobacter aporrectodeae]MCW8208330.1 hypothetical protein [Verminephrobacter aporrectodeae subsp. tuberculatae]